ncbi:DUF262 domain-containing protein [Gilliamella sp. G0441]|uniref:DUF262 domain-containing protein n=1 Tax=Gilliamella sp. G0441 TaxID=3384760 RepID=UPI003D334F9A
MKFDKEKTELDNQITEEKRITDHQIREYPLEVIYDKFIRKLKDGTTELFVPEYQRSLVWNEIQQSRFIESLLLDIPIPYIFAADVGDGKNKGKLEIVDGSQRIRTIVNFIDNKFTLKGLKKLTKANGFKFEDFSDARQLRFLRITLRMIELTELAKEETRRDIFDRLNTGGTKLTDMEQRRGSLDGPFMQFLDNLSQNEIFKKICPISERRSDRAENTEMLLRYFAYKDNYLNYKKSVKDFLSEYLDKMNQSFTKEEETKLTKQFIKMCSFIDKYVPNGFRKSSTSNTVPRVRFEVLSVGASLALKINPKVIPLNINKWITSDEFLIHTKSDASNSRPKLRARLEYARDRFLNK